VLLALDVGNTQLKCALFRERVLLHRLRTATVPAAGAAQLEQLFLGWLQQQGVSSAQIDAAIIASVVPQLTPAIEAALRNAFSVQALVVRAELDTGITLRGPDPRELGADRLVNGAAAWAELQLARAQGGPASSSIVVDLGTATKLDCVSAQGEFLGGVIAPGVSVSLDALVARAARLRAVELRAPERVLGRSTIECVQSGLLHGHASLVDGMVSRLRRELSGDPGGGAECQVIATGGYAALIAPLTETLRRVEPDLTLHGLRTIHERNPR
jgi:type III pantothenate kinase